MKVREIPPDQYLLFVPVLVSQKFVSKVHTMAAAEVELKSPFVPLFQRGHFLRAILTPLWKSTP
jgi:hypothetical protein